MMLNIIMKMIFMLIFINVSNKIHSGNNEIMCQTPNKIYLIHKNVNLNIFRYKIISKK